MTDHTDLIQLARKRGDERIDIAIGQLHKQAEILANAAGIPDNVAGCAPGALLGRISYVPSMSRDLRQTLSRSMSAIELNKITDVTNQLDVQAEMDAPPPVMPVGINTAKALEDTELSPPIVAALKANDIFTIGDVMGIPDEHLLKMRGIATRSLQAIKGIIK